MLVVTRLCEFYPGIFLTTEEKARKNLIQGNRRVLVHILHTQCYQNTHTLQNYSLHNDSLYNGRRLNQGTPTIRQECNFQ
jgi:hypothetical protein